MMLDSGFSEHVKKPNISSSTEAKFTDYNVHVEESRRDDVISKEVDVYSHLLPSIILVFL